MTTETLRAASFLDKGGTGKTTVTAHFGVALATNGYDVLLIDLSGKQGDLADHFGEWDRVDDDDWPNITTVFQDEWHRIAEKLGETAVDDLIIPTGEGPDLIPAHRGLDTLDEELSAIDNASDKYSRLDTFLTDHIDPRGYDVILIDLPGLTNNVSYNGLWAANHVIAPVEMGSFERKQAVALHTDLQEIERNFGMTIDLTMVLPNKVDQRTNLADKYLDEFEALYSDSIAPVHVPMSQDIRNAADAGRTIFALENPSNTAQRARDAFMENATELVARLEDHQ